MDQSGQVICPYCGQRFELEIDATVDRQVLGVDCEICCRPFAIVLACEGGEIITLESRPE